MSQQTLELDFPEAIIHYPIENGDGPRLLWKIVHDLLPLGDLLTEKGADIAAAFDLKVSCRAGCGVCCRQMVPLSPPEAAIIADVVDHLQEKSKRDVLGKFSDAVEKLTGEGLLETLLEMYRAGADRKVVMDNNRKYFDLSIYCPFLVDGSCSIYPHRPSRCREYSVLSPSEYCTDPFDRRIRRLPLSIKLCETFSIIWSTLTATSPVIIPLVYALEWVRDHPDITTLVVAKGDVSRLMQSTLETACERANTVARKRVSPDIGRRGPTWRCCGRGER